MDKETLSNYGWIVICVLVLAVMIALATPFGSYVADGFKATYNGFGDTNTEATDMMYSAVGVKVPASCGIEGHYKGDNRGTHGIPATNCPKGHRYTCECVGWVVPEGGTYTMYRAVNGKSVYNAGERLPNDYRPQNQDKYEYEDYSYGVNYKNSADYSTYYWYVQAKDKTKTEYSEILTEIAGLQIKSLNSTFYKCTNLKVAPAIPSGVTSMYRTFGECTSLTTAPATIPNGVTNISWIFSHCSSLTTVPVIPDSVTDMTQAFEYCYILTGTIEINANPQYYNECFKITHAPITLTGSSTMLNELASTATYSNITVAQ